MASYLEKPVEFKEFAGLRNTTAKERLSLEDMQVALNVDIDDAKRIERRTGQTLRLSGASHSLFSDGQTCLVVQGTTLKSVRATGTGAYAFDTLRSGLTSGARMSYWSVNGVIYYSNGYQTGVVQANASRSWGLTQPIGQPVASAIGGYLPPGRYRYAVTFLRNDRQESGTGVSGTIDLASTGGIHFSGIPVSDDPTVDRKVIYLTPTNAEVLYQAMVISNDDTTADYRNEGYDLRLKLNTQFGRPAPAGHIVSYFRGCTLVAVGPVLWRSLPYRHELFMFGKDFNLFDADITLVAPVADGVFVATNQTYFLRGADPGKWTLDVVADYGAIPGTLSYIQAEQQYVGQGLPGHSAVWASPRGHCRGTDDGTFMNLTESRYSYPTAQRGAGLMRQVNGFNQFLAVLEGTGSANNASS